MKDQLRPSPNPPTREGNNYLCLLVYIFSYLIRDNISYAAVFAQILGINKTDIRILLLLLFNYFRDVPADVIAHKKKKKE